MPRQQKYDHAEIRKRYVDLGHSPADIAEYFAPREKDDKAYKLALKRIRALIKQQNLEQIQQGVRAIEPEVRKVVQDRRATLLKTATAEYVWIATQIAAVRTRLGITPGGDGEPDKQREVTAEELEQHLDLLAKLIKGLESIGLSLAPPPITPIFDLGGAGILAASADKQPGSDKERTRLIILYERLQNVAPSPPPPGVEIDYDDDED